MALSIRLSVELYSAGRWSACDLVADLMGEEPILRCSEVSAVLRAHGRVIARYMVALKSDCIRFRILARETATGVLVAYWGAFRSSETGRFLWEAPDPIVMCEWCPIASRCPDKALTLST